MFWKIRLAAQNWGDYVHSSRTDVVGRNVIVSTTGRTRRPGDDTVSVSIRANGCG
jgi:hypothetical protein